MPENEVVVLAETSEIEASILISLLRDSGVSAWIEGGNTNAALGFSGSGSPLSVRVLIAKQDEAKAKDILLKTKTVAQANEGSWEKGVRSRARTSSTIYVVGGLAAPIIFGAIAQGASEESTRIVAMLLAVFIPVAAVIMAVLAGKRRRMQ